MKAATNKSGSTAGERPQIAATGKRPRGAAPVVRTGVRAGPWVDSA